MTEPKPHIYRKYQLRLMEMMKKRERKRRNKKKNIEVKRDMNKVYNKWVKSWRKNNKDKFRKLKRVNNNRYNHRYPERSKFSRVVYDLLKKKIITKKPCIICGGTNQLEACTLSESPQEPLWFCDSCHKQFHKNIKDKALIKKIVNLS